MFRKISAILLVTLLPCLGVAPIRVRAGQEASDAQLAAKVKASVAKRGTGKKARVTVELRDRRKVKGYISSAGPDDFVVVDPETGHETRLAYGEVGRVSGRGMSKGAKMGLIVGIGAGVTALAFCLAVRDALDDFEARFTDIFAVQDEISREVLSKLSLHLTGEEQRGLAKRYTENAEAYQLYLKGLYHWRTFEREGLLKSLNFYGAAIEKDPQYALAYAGLANAYTVIGVYGPLPTAEAMGKARDAALKALALDEELPEARVALGAVKIFHEWDWPGAERELKRAIELAPDSADGYNLYGYYLQATGRQEEAVEAMRKAAEAAPQWKVVTHDHLESTFGARRYGEAIALCLDSLRLEPEEPYVLWVLGRSYMMKGRLDEAVAQFERGLAAIEGSHDVPTARVWLLSGLGYAHARAGRRGEALKVVALIRESGSRWESLYVVMVLAGLGERDQAFAVLDEAYRERVPFLWQVRFLPEYDALRPDPRYAELLERMNLTP